MLSPLSPPDSPWRQLLLLSEENGVHEKGRANRKPFFEWSLDTVSQKYVYDYDKQYTRRVIIQYSSQIMLVAIHIRSHTEQAAHLNATAPANMNNSYKRLALSSPPKKSHRWRAVAPC